MTKKKPPIPQPGKLPELDKQATLLKIQSWLMVGLSIKKACNAYNVKTAFKDYVSPSTVGAWYQEIDSVRDQIDAWRESPDVAAHKAWIDAMRVGNFAAAKAWLEVKDKETFGPKEDTQPRMIIEFATGPSPFTSPNASPDAHVSVQVPQPHPQRKGFDVAQTKKKSVKPSSSKKPKSGPSTKKTSNGEGKKDGDGATASKSK